MKSKQFVLKAVCIFFWIVVWEIVAGLLGSSLLLPAPSRVFLTVVSLLERPEFYKSVLHSLMGIWVGFGSAFLAAVLLGFCSMRLVFLRYLLSPLVTGMKSIPIASFIILALIWLGSGYLAVLAAVLVTFPVIYINTLEGLSTRSQKMQELAKVFRFSRFKRWWYLDMAALRPFLLGGAKVAVGMSWKSGIAAEVIGIPRNSIGEQFYLAKIYLNTTELFAWTAVVVILSIMSEKLILGLAGGWRYRYDHKL